MRGLDLAERYVATMPDLFETTQIPDDFAHWDALAARVAVAASCESKQGGFHWLATSRGGWVVVSLLLAVMFACVLLPAPGRPRVIVAAIGRGFLLQQTTWESW